MHRWSIAALAVSCLAVAACAVDAREPATTYLDDIRAHASAFELSLSTHRAHVDAASSLAVLATLEQQHLQDATTHMGGMGQDVEGMCGCTNDRGDPMTPHAMRQLVDGAMQECARHHAAMSDVDSMAAAMAEEEHHQAVMSGVLGAMMNAHDQMMMGGTMGGGMMGGAGTFSCPGGG